MKPGILRLQPPSKRKAPGPSDTEELFAAIREDSDGWRRLAFDMYHDLVRGLLVKALGPNMEIDDLTADVFVSFFTSARNIRSASGVRSYVVSVTMNTVRGEIRGRKRRALLGRISGAGLDLERSPGTDDPKAKAALLQLSRILEQLDAEERIAFVLHSLDGMALPEIAAALKVSLSTAKRRVSRAQEHVLKRVSRNALLADYIADKTERINA